MTDRQTSIFRAIKLFFRDVGRRAEELPRGQRTYGALQEIISDLASRTARFRGIPRYEFRPAVWRNRTMGTLDVVFDSGAPMRHGDSATLTISNLHPSGRPTVRGLVISNYAGWETGPSASGNRVIDYDYLQLTGQQPLSTMQWSEMTVVDDDAPDYWAPVLAELRINQNNNSKNSLRPYSNVPTGSRSLRDSRGDRAKRWHDPISLENYENTATSRPMYIRGQPTKGDFAAMSFDTISRLDGRHPTTRERFSMKDVRKYKQ